jgi:hypothetical protein
MQEEHMSEKKLVFQIDRVVNERGVDVVRLVVSGDILGGGTVVRELESPLESSPVVERSVPEGVVTSCLDKVPTVSWRGDQYYQVDLVRHVYQNDVYLEARRQVKEKFGKVDVVRLQDQIARLQDQIIYFDGVVADQKKDLAKSERDFRKINTDLGEENKGLQEKIGILEEKLALEVAVAVKLRKQLRSRKRKTR